MSRTAALPGAITGAVDEVRSATDRLTAAARNADADGIRGAIDDRAVAMQRLDRAVSDAAETLAEPARAMLREVGRELQDQADLAERALRDTMDGTRTALEALARGSRAARRYRNESAAVAALDRSG